MNFTTVRWDFTEVSQGQPNSERIFEFNVNNSLTSISKTFYSDLNSNMFIWFYSTNYIGFLDTFSITSTS